MKIMNTARKSNVGKVVKLSKLFDRFMAQARAVYTFPKVVDQYLVMHNHKDLHETLKNEVLKHTASDPDTVKQQQEFENRKQAFIDWCGDAYQMLYDKFKFWVSNGKKKIKLYTCQMTKTKYFTTGSCMYIYY